MTDECSGLFLPLVHPSVCGTLQQAHACSRFLNYWTALCTVMYCPDTRSVFTAPLGAKVNDVQLGRRVGPCQCTEEKKKNLRS